MKLLGYIFGVLAIISTIGAVFFNPSQYIMAFMSALMCYVIYEEVKTEEEEKKR